MPDDLKLPAIKLARRIQSLMKNEVVLRVIVREFDGEWYLSIDNGKWEKLGK